MSAAAAISLIKLTETESATITSSASAPIRGAIAGPMRAGASIQLPSKKRPAVSASAGENER